MKSGILSHLKAIIILPFGGVVVIPAVILFLAGGAGGAWGWDFPPSVVQAVIGSLLVAAGLYLLVSTIGLFATVGEGTLAPWEPPGRLVVAGIYRYVRNPMISGVLMILFGESALFDSLPLLCWCLFFFAANDLYFRFSEEPALARSFGDEYADYRRNVPRWIPRFTPWTGTATGDQTAGPGPASQDRE